MRNNDALNEFRGPEPKPGDDPAPSLFVADDDGSPAPLSEAPAGAESPRPAEAPQPAPAPKVAPFDDRRAKIAARFDERRKQESQDPDPAVTNPGGIYGTLAGEGSPAPEPPDDDGGGKPAAPADDATPKAPATPGPSALEGGAKPEMMTLVVNGKTVTKSLAEVAALSDMSVDEVKAEPTRATRYAQKELAAEERLDKAQRILREIPSRSTDDAGARPASPGSIPGPTENGDDAVDQQPGGRDTSADDLAKLIEDIQIGDPKEVGPKLKNLIEAAASGVVQQSQGNQLRQAELTSNTTAVKEFLDDHPEAVGKPAIAAALGRQMDEEYRADIRTALLAEGRTEQEADEVLAKTPSAKLRNVHLDLRLERNPHVRRIDKAFVAETYDKVRADFGIPAQTPNNPQPPSRQARKDVLPAQPRRASVPPATPPAPTAPQSRRAVVAEMASRTGRKRSSLPG